VLIAPSVNVLRNVERTANVMSSRQCAYATQDGREQTVPRKFVHAPENAPRSPNAMLRRNDVFVTMAGQAATVRRSSALTTAVGMVHAMPTLGNVHASQGGVLSIVAQGLTTKLGATTTRVGL